ncbi:hypothetical protein ACIPSE_04800 [Streptomyces sp. NPDC090106]|uniref:hypothetical protein n=1 Tax=Streptomyces sp. NPDC090106 TaxID=3365946 RepID=UPI00382914DE
MHIGAGIVDVHPGGGIAEIPRFVVSGALVMVGPYADSEQHEMHLLATCGAGNWQDSAEDEFRFGGVDRALSSMILQVPSGTKVIDEDCAGWLLTPYEEVGFRLSLTGDFTVPKCVTSLTTPTGDRLVCGISGFPSVGSESRRRLRVCRDLDLLFSGSRYVGWILSSPVEYMTSGWIVAESSSPDSELAEVLRDYLILNTEHFHETLEEGDAASGDALRQLMARIQTDHGAVAGRRALRDCITEILDWYF